MTRINRFFAAGLFAACLALAGVAQADDKKPANEKKPAKPQVEVVFCLDTTGSMGGLIEGAKAKIWSISNQIASGKPTPEVKIGLVAYRDKGDEYITQVTDLSGDLDAIYAKLKTFQAAGGGDTPESVNQGLYDSVHKIKWSTDKKTLRIIFLVGDAPPHMDYTDDVKYPETCKKACEKGIIINTVQCGNDADCTKFWRDICAKAEGSFVQIQQDGGVVAVETPFDKRLGEINGELVRTTVVYGDAKTRAIAKDKAETTATLPAPAAADRVGFLAKGAAPGGGGFGGFGGGAGGPGGSSYDLLQAVKSKQVELEKLKDDQLPDEMKKMSVKERKEYLEKLDKKRDDLQKEVLELDRKRTDFINKKLAEDKKAGKDGFDNKVLDTLRKQAEKVNIKY